MSLSRKPIAFLLDHLFPHGPANVETALPSRGRLFRSSRLPLDGQATPASIKAHPAPCSIPIVVLTAVIHTEDIYRRDDVGARSFLSKPLTVRALVEVMHGLGQSWCEVVPLPLGLGPR